MNRNYGKLTDGAIVYAPNNVRIGDTIYANPTAAQYLACGWKAVNAAAPEEEAPSGKHWAADGWEETDAAISRKWKQEDDAPVVTRYSKLKLITAAKQAGKWDALKAWIAAAGYSDEWAACMYLSDDYDGFDGIKAAIVAAGIATDDELTAILAAAEDETLQGA